MHVMRSAETPATAEVILRVCNHSAVTVQLFWVDHSGVEVPYATLEPGQPYNQSTYSTHPWRLRDARTGAVLCEYVGATATVTLSTGGQASVQPGLHYDSAAAHEPPHPSWGSFRKRAEALGIPIRAYDCVGEVAVAIAARTLECMLADVDAGILQLMCQRGAELAIIGRDQVTTDIPAHRHLKGQKCEGEERTFDDGCRGLGGHIAIPTTSVGEENLTMVGDARYPAESILVHEFAHAVMDVGLHGHPLHAAIEQAHCQAKAQGLHDPGCYMMANPCEYWAEGSQAWFNATIRTDVTSGITTRELLKARDPELASLMTTVYGDGPWRYPQTAPCPFTMRAPGPAARRPAVDAMAGVARLAAGASAAAGPGRSVVIGMQRDGGAAAEGAPLLAGAARKRGLWLLRPLAPCLACFGGTLGRRKGPSPARRAPSGPKGN